MSEPSYMDEWHRDHESHLIEDTQRWAEEEGCPFCQEICGSAEHSGEAVK